MGGTCFAEFYFSEDAHHGLIYRTHQVSLESVKNLQRYIETCDLKAWASHFCFSGQVGLHLRLLSSTSHDHGNLDGVSSILIMYSWLLKSWNMNIFDVKNATSFLGTKYIIKIWALIEPKIWVCVYDVIINLTISDFQRKCSEKSVDFQKSIFRC